MNNYNISKYCDIEVRKCVSKSGNEYYSIGLNISGNYVQLNFLTRKQFNDIIELFNK